MVASGTAEVNGELWGARASDWADQEARHLPIYEAALGLVPVGPGMLVLDVGCGSGVFLRAAADRGARVFGLDASPALAALARARVPEANVRVGDLQFLPYAPATFDVVTGFNAFQFAADTTAALREAGRVARPGAPVVVQVWGRPQRCDVVAVMGALAPLLPPPPADGPPAPVFFEPGVLEESARAAGLEPEAAFAVETSFDYPDEETLLRALGSSAGAVRASWRSGEEAVRAALAEAASRFRRPDGSYRLENEWRFLVARAGCS